MQESPPPLYFMQLTFMVHIHPYLQPQLQQITLQYHVLLIRGAY